MKEIEQGVTCAGSKSCSDNLCISGVENRQYILKGDICEILDYFTDLLCLHDIFFFFKCNDVDGKKLQMNFLSEYFLGNWDNRNTSIFNMCQEQSGLPP